MSNPTSVSVPEEALESWWATIAAGFIVWYQCTAIECPCNFDACRKFSVSSTASPARMATRVQPPSSVVMSQNTVIPSGMEGGYTKYSPSEADELAALISLQERGRSTFFWSCRGKPGWQQHVLRLGAVQANSPFPQP